MCHNQKHVNLGLGRLSYWAVMLLLLLFGIVEQPLLPSFISQRSGNSINYFIDMKIFQTQKWKKYYILRFTEIHLAIIVFLFRSAQWVLCCTLLLFCGIIPQLLVPAPSSSFFGQSIYRPLKFAVGRLYFMVWRMVVWSGGNNQKRQARWMWHIYYIVATPELNPGSG